MHAKRLMVLLTAASIVLTACGDQGQNSPSPTTQHSTSSSSAPTDFAPMAYPASGPVECGGDYTGELSQIVAVDEHTVEFHLCSPDVAFLSKVAFSAFAINDSDWLQQHGADHSIVAQPNGTGPYKFVEWVRGDHITYQANPDYWGTPAKTPNLIFRWSSESAQRLVELRAGTVHGIDNVGTSDFSDISSDTALKLIPREGLNTFYVGMNNTDKPWDDVRVRKAIAMGIDRDRLVANFYPPGSEVATHFVPCAIPFACEGDDWYSFDPDSARQLLAEAGFPNGFTTKIQYRNVDRNYLPNAPIVAQELQAQLKANLGIDATIEEQESGTFIDNNNNGNLEGLFLLGWGADYPDPTNFLDYHFGSGSGKKFGKPFEDIVDALNRGASTPDEEERRAAYEEANNLIKEHVPMALMTHAGSATAWGADVEGAHSSPLSNEVMAAVRPPQGDTLVWMQNAEPIGLYCADETDGESLRACEQVMESLYAYEVGGTNPEPALAKDCTPNDELDVWTCHLREGVTFHNGAPFDANDVVLSYAVAWDAKHELHVGNTGAFEYFPGLWGGFLNPPPAE